MMNKKMMLLVFLILVASPMLFGQTPNNPTANGHWVAITAGFSMAIASGMCGLAQAKAVAAARARKATVVFDVVEITAPSSGADIPIGNDAVTVARAIEAQGVPATRVNLLARPEADAVPREVRVYIR